MAPMAPPANHPGLSVHEVDDSGRRTGAALPPAQGMLTPHGFGGFGGFGYDSMLSSAGGSGVSSFSSFTSYSSTSQGGGQPLVYRASTSTRSVGGVTEAMHEEYDSRSQKEKLAIKRSVAAPGQLERGRVVERERQLGTDWGHQKVDTLLNLHEHEIDSFDSEWRQRAQVRVLICTLCVVNKSDAPVLLHHTASWLATDPRQPDRPGSEQSRSPDEQLISFACGCCR